MANYYTLLVREGGRWCREFGDYSRDVVKEEKEEYRNRSFNPYAAKDLKIIVTGDKEEDIQSAIVGLNNAADFCRNGFTAMTLRDGNVGELHETLANIFGE